MRTTITSRRRADSAALTTDLVTIRGAIELVAARQARRVTLSGLRFGERLLPRVSVEGAQVGVDVSLDRGTVGTAALVVTPAKG
jgi:hypothetical protein